MANQQWASVLMKAMKPGSYYTKNLINFVIKSLCIQIVIRNVKLRLIDASYGDEENDIKNLNYNWVFRDGIFKNLSKPSPLVLVWCSRVKKNLLCWLHQKLTSTSLW